VSARESSDPLFDLYRHLRDALAPFGIEAGADVLHLWREMQMRGRSAFTGSGEFRPAVVRRLAEVVEEIQRSTADEPTGAPR
jgi:hypothetical protein